MAYYPNNPMIPPPAPGRLYEEGLPGPPAAGYHRPSDLRTRMEALPPPPMLAPPPSGAGRHWSEALTPIATALSAGLAAIGGPDSGLGHFGLGGAKQGSSMMLQEAIEKRHREAEEDSNRMKRADELVAELATIQDMDPRAGQILLRYQQAMQDGKLDGKEAGEIIQQASGLDMKGLSAAKKARADQQAYETRRRADQTIEEEGLKRTGIPIQVGGKDAYLTAPQYLEHEQAKAAATRQAEMDAIQKENIRLDNLRAEGAAAMAREKHGWERSLYNEAKAEKEKKISPEAIALAGDALLSGHARSLTEAVSQIQPDRKKRGATGVEVMRYLQDKALLPAPAIKQLQAINTSNYVLHEIERLMEDVIKHRAHPVFGPKALDEFNKFQAGNAANIATALGEVGRKTEGDIQRALALSPNWWRIGVFPDHARSILSNQKRLFDHNTNNLLKLYSPRYRTGELQDRVRAAAGGATNLPSPPLPPIAERVVGQTYIMKDGKSAKWTGNGFE